MTASELRRTAARTRARTAAPTARAALACAILIAAPLQASTVDSVGRPVLVTRSKGATDPPKVEAWRSGLKALDAGNVVAAKAGFDAALEIDPKFVPALLGLAAIAQAQRRVDDVDSLLRRADLADPKSSEVQLAWGRHHLVNRRPMQAEKSFIAARNLAPKAAEPLIDLGNLYLTMPGRQADALTAYRSAVALQDNSAPAQFGLGTAAALAGRTDEALRALGRAADLRPKDADALRSIALLHLDLGAHDRALAALDRGLARKPDDVPMMLDRAEVLMRMNRLDDALEQLKRARTLAPALPQLLVKVGDVHQAARRWNDAEQSYLEAIRLAPKTATAFNNLAWMAVTRGGDTARALDWARQAVALSDRSSPFHDTLGWVQRAAGKLDAAAASLARAIELEPNVSTYHFHLGIVEQERRRFTAARASFRRAQQLEPDGPQAAEVRSRLAALPPD